MSAEMDFKSFMVEGVNGEFHFLSAGGVNDEGCSPSTKSINNEALVIDVEPLTSVHPLEFDENIGDSDDAPSEKDEITFIDRSIVDKAQNQKVGASLKANGKRKQITESSGKESRTRKLISTLLKAREVKKDKAYAELERKCNEALLDLDKNPLMLDMRSEI
ncbi:hypothetical protein Tco_1086107 [Tanacetum coccineum]